METNKDNDVILRLFFILGHPELINNDTAFEQWKEKIKKYTTESKTDEI